MSAAEDISSARAATGQEKQSRRRIVAGVVTGLALVGLLALLVGRIAAAQRVAATAPSGPLVGQAAPNFTLSVWNGEPGQTLTLNRATAGRPVLLNFWAPWCEPCQGEASALAAAWKTYAPRGVVFVGIAYDTTRADSLSFLRQHGLSYLCGPDTGTSVAAAYAVSGIPVTILIDRHGIVAQRLSGAQTTAMLATALNRLLAR
ncbi:MAG TPA: TlpA disulfide reductase family protein [Ktedonobacterales bacterium]|nr:TlpA disulfide reductase family protein [Ktedonobacterales bacterium]